MQSVFWGSSKIRIAFNISLLANSKHKSLIVTNIVHTYIISHRNTLVSLVLVSLMLCVLILYMNGGTYSIKSARNNRFFFFLANFMYSESFWQKSTERQSQKKSSSISRFVRDIWPGIWIVTSRLKCQHNTYLIYSFIIIIIGH